MSQVSQFIAKPRVAPVAVFAGPNELLSLYAQQVFIDLLPADRSFERLSAQSTSVKAVIERLREVNPFGYARVFLVTDINRWSNMDDIAKYAEDPYPDTYLMLQAPTLKRQSKERWLPTSKKVLPVDCGNVSESALKTFVKAAGGVSASAAERIIAESQGDMEYILMVVDWCSVFDKPPLDDILPHRVIDSILADYGVTSEDGRTMLRQLRRRVEQLMRLSVALGTQRTFRQIATDLSLEPFQVSQWADLAKSMSSQAWMQKLVRLSDLEYSATQPGFKRYLELIMS